MAPPVSTTETPGDDVRSVRASGDRRTLARAWRNTGCSAQRKIVAIYISMKIFIFNILHWNNMDYFEAILHRAASAVTAAADACREWEDGGDAGPVADTAWQADEATVEALEAVAGIDPTLILDTCPETRLGRLAMATRILVLAGTDEGGESQDLEIAAKLLTKATAL